MDNYNEKRESSVRRINVSEEPRSQATRTVDTAAVRAARRTEEPRRRSPRRRRTLDRFVIYLIIDAVIIGAFLMLFAYLHHVNPIFTKLDEPTQLPIQEQAEEPVVEDPVADEPAAEDPTAPDEPQPSEPAEPQHKFEDKFSDTVVHTENQYISKNVNATVTTTTENGVTYHVADIYVRDVKYLQADYATDKGFGLAKENRALIQDAAKRVNAFVAINGDQCGQHSDGMVVRNGVMVRQSEKEDVCVLNYDGTLVTYGESEFDTQAIIDAGAWQVWTFGPELLDDNGQPLAEDEYNTTVGGANPRSAIGMIEPLHYVLVTVDGRGESAGLTMRALAELMQKLGCTAAYNLDGGGTAAMAVNGEVYSTPSKVRSVTDIVYVAMED